MQNINITVNLSEEDRARLDKIIDLLGQHAPATIATPTAEDDALRKKLEQAVASVKPAEADPRQITIDDLPLTDAETAQEATEAPTATDTPAEVEAPATEAPAPQETAKVTLADLQGKVIALVQAGKKAEVRTICTAYAQQVTQIPEEKWSEVMTKLTALEG